MSVSMVGAAVDGAGRTVAQVTDQTYSVNKFYDVLLTVPDWQDKRPGDAAPAVERSGFPDRYHKWEPMAAAPGPVPSQPRG